jgi:hypothetical protein
MENIFSDKKAQCKHKKYRWISGILFVVIVVLGLLLLSENKLAVLSS